MNRSMGIDVVVGACHAPSTGPHLKGIHSPGGRRM